MHASLILLYLNNIWYIKQILFKGNYDVILVHGYNNFTNIIAILFAKIFGIKVLFRGDTRLNKNHHNDKIKSIFKRLLFRFIDGFVCIGKLNKEYYISYGVPRSKIYFAPFCVNNAAFKLNEQNKFIERNLMRDLWGIDKDALCILSASKLTTRKRVDDLIKAFALIQDSIINSWLIIAGNGDQIDNLTKLASNLNITRVKFIGFQNQSELPKLYASSDIFVIPSSDEPWGLVVNEAMAAGLPIVSSDDVGAAHDLVAGMDTGIVYKSGDIEGLSKALMFLLTSSTTRK